MRSKLTALWNKLKKNTLLVRAFHTFWQVFAGHLVAALLVAHNSGDVKLAVTMSAAAALSALKTFIVSYIDTDQA